MMPIVDLHCDLLAYLAKDSTRDANNREVRCSIPDLKEGGVRYQTLAIYTETQKGSTAFAKAQFQIFEELPKKYPGEFRHLSQNMESGGIYIAPAIENASGLCEEDEPLELCFRRLQAYHKQNPILYLSLTWNTENRFGGGNHTKIGLKRDGELLLEYLAELGIAIDFSHTSDPLAFAILQYIDQKNLPLVPIASHSNFRSVHTHPRNLPDAVAQEIIRRGGVIGINLVWKFVGDLMRQFEFAQKLDPALEHLALGADFFYYKDLQHLAQDLPFFNPIFGDASCYPTLITKLKTIFSETQVANIAYQNGLRFLTRQYAPCR